MEFKDNPIIHTKVGHQPPVADGGWKRLRPTRLSLGPVSPSGSSPSAPPPGLHSAHCQTWMPEHTPVINICYSGHINSQWKSLWTRESLLMCRAGHKDDPTCFNYIMHIPQQRHRYRACPLRVATRTHRRASRCINELETCVFSVHSTVL